MSLSSVCLILTASCSAQNGYVHTQFGIPPEPAKPLYTVEELTRTPESVLRKILAYEVAVDEYVDAVTDRARVHNELLDTP